MPIRSGERKAGFGGSRFSALLVPNDCMMSQLYTCPSAGRSREKFGGLFRSGSTAEMKRGQPALKRTHRRHVRASFLPCETNQPEMNSEFRSVGVWDIWR